MNEINDLKRLRPALALTHSLLLARYMLIPRYMLLSLKMLSIRSMLVALTMLLLSAQTVLAEGFPGVGDRNDYADALPHYNLGNRYLAKEWYEKAVEKYIDAIGIYPYDADVYTNLAIAYRKLGQTQEAERACKKALDLKPEDWMAWSNLANLLMIQDKYPEAYHYFKGALKHNPPAEERLAIQSNIEGMTKIMKAKGLTLDGKPIDAEPQSPTHHVAGGRNSAGSAGRKTSSKGKNQTGLTTNGVTHRRDAGAHKRSGLIGSKQDPEEAAQPQHTQSEVDNRAYEKWLGAP